MSRLTNWFQNLDTLERVTVACAALGVAGVIIAAFITGGFQLLSTLIQQEGDDGSQSKIQSTPPVAGAGPPARIPPPNSSSISPGADMSCGERFRIEAPPDLQKVSNSSGVLVEGEACSGAHIWLLDYDTFDGYLYQVNKTPISVVNGKWAFLNEPIGDNADKIGTIYTIAALNVSSECNSLLLAAKPDSDNTVRFKPLPRECPQIASGPDVKLVRVVKDGE